MELLKLHQHGNSSNVYTIYLKLQVTTRVDSIKSCEKLFKKPKGNNSVINLIKQILISDSLQHTVNFKRLLQKMHMI